MKIEEYNEELIDKALEKLTQDVIKETLYMYEHNPYNNSMVYIIISEAFYLGKSSNNFEEFKKRLKKIISVSKTIKDIKNESKKSTKEL